MGDSFDNLAMAATAKNNTIDNLVKCLSQLTATNAKQSEQIIKLTEELKKALVCKTSTNTPRTQDLWLNPNGYCWTHGYKIGWKHSSSNCGTKAEGHKNGATRQDTMGSSSLGAGFGNAPNEK